MKWAEDLKEWMEETGLTYKSVGRLIGCTESYVHKMVNGNRPANLNMAIKIEKITKGKVSLDTYIKEVKANV